MKRLAAWLVVALAALFVGAPAFAAIDWAKAPGKEVVLLYPAQMSWELLLTQKEHSGADKFRAGKDCRACHEHHEHESGALMVVDKSAEPTPIPGKPGFLKATVKFARDDERLYVRVDFDPGYQPDAGMDKDYVTKVAFMFDDGHVAEMARGGCWVTCHDNLAKMPSGGDGDTTKYLARSRVKMARTGGDQIKPDADLAQLRANGEYLEYWQAHIKPDGSVSAVDGTILEKRKENAAPAVTATATQAGGALSVVLSRKLVAGAPYKDFTAGKTYNFGMSIHAGHAARRFHYVSLEKTLVIDQGAADFVAARN
jgi:cytochrome c-type protein NapC